jgi:hypothetical protein
VSTRHGYWLNPWLQRTPQDAVAQTYRELATLVADGTLAAPIEATYALADYREALAHAPRNDGNGKALSDEGRTAGRAPLRRGDESGQRGARLTQGVAVAADHRVDDGAVQEHEHDVRSLLGIGHADFAEQRSQFVEHPVLVRDNHRYRRVTVVGQIESGAHVRAADEAGPEAIGDARGVVEHGKQPLARCPVRGLAE